MVYKISDGYKVADQRTITELFSTHSYKRNAPNCNSTSIMTLTWLPTGQEVPLYHLALNYHQPTYGGHLPLDTVFPYREDGKNAIILSRLVSASGEAQLRETVEPDRKSRLLHRLKAKLLHSGIMYAFEQMGAGIVIDYIDKKQVKLMDEAQLLVRRVCEEIQPADMLRDIGKYYATYWPHSSYLR